ncbi:MAG TPA: Minf_1886 family protein [Phycisphaerales bacterium]|nr:Minf_1886 family protein [Phycisphaerales bacterium]
MSEQVDWKSIREKAGPFPPQAYQFVRDGLAHTSRLVHGDRGEHDESRSRHVSGQQLCLGLRDFAIRQYGAMARTVLESWHIKTTSDFGRIVYAMIDAGMMRKTDEDDFGDFEGVFEFDEAFADLTPA